MKRWRLVAWVGAAATLTGLVVMGASPSSASTPTCGGLSATVVGTVGDDDLIGTEGDDVIWAGPGDDEILALGGNDVVCDGHGNDTVDAGAGDDTVFAEPGSDDVFTDVTGQDWIDFQRAHRPITLDLDSSEVQRVDAAGNTIRLLGQWENFVGGHGSTVYVRPGADPRTVSDVGGGGRVVYDAGGEPVVVNGGKIDHPTLGTVDIDGLMPYIVNQPPSVVDDGDAGYVAPGFFPSDPGFPQGFDGGVEYSAADSGNTAMWTFDDVPPGLYLVSATWTFAPDRATNAPFSISDDGGIVSEVEVNQEAAPDDFAADGFSWERLDLVDVRGGSLEVRLTDVGADQYVIADAIRIQPLAPSRALPDTDPPGWLPDPGDVGIVALPPVTSVTVTPVPGALRIDGTPPVVDPDQPPIVGYVGVVNPGGQVIEGSTLPLIIEVDDDAGLYRVDLLARSQVVASAPSVVEGVAPLCKSGFADISPTHVFCNEIDGLAELGITGGYPDGTFRPAREITRMAMSAWFARSLEHAGFPGPQPCVVPPFSDVPITHPFCPEIALAADAGILAGFGDGSFRPADLVTRQAAAAWLQRWRELLGDPPPIECTDPPFTDVPVSHPFCREIAFVAAASIAKGYDDGAFRPAGNITRQAASAMMHRSIGE